MTKTYIIETGSYFGDSVSQSISIGWPLAALFIATSRDANPISQNAWSIKTDTMSGDGFVANDTDAQFVATGNGGITFTADGFDTGDNIKINRSGIEYFWVAFRKGPQIDTGSYTGDGVNGRQIIEGEPRQPAMVMTMTESSVSGGFGALSTVWKWANVPGRLSAQFGTINHNIQAIGILPDGFDLAVGSSPPSGITIRVNQLDSEYHYIVFYESDGSTVQFNLGDWDGDDADPQKITTGQQPKFLLVYGQTRTSIQDWAYVSLDYPSDRTSLIHSFYEFSNDIEDRITILPDGFEANGEWNESSRIYRYIAGYF